MALIVIPRRSLRRSQPLAGQSRINPSIPRPVFCYVGGPTGRDLISGNVGSADPGVSEASGGAVAEAQHFDSFATDTDGVGFGIGGIPVGTGDCSFFVVMKTASTRPTHETLMLTTGSGSNKYHIGTRLSGVGKFQFVLTDVTIIESNITNVADTWYAAGFVYKKNVNCYFSVRKDLLSGDPTIYKAETSETSSPLTGSTSTAAAIGEKGLGGGFGMAGSVAYFAAWDFALLQSLMDSLVERPLRLFNPRTQRIFMTVGGTKTATFVLNDKDSAAVANATGIRAAWFDQMPGSSMAAPTDVSAIETSDGSGNHTINIPNSTLTSGQTGYYAISNSDGTIATNHLQGGGPAKVD